MFGKKTAAPEPPAVETAPAKPVIDPKAQLAVGEKVTFPYLMGVPVTGEIVAIKSGRALLALDKPLVVVGLDEIKRA